MAFQYNAPLWNAPGSNPTANLVNNGFVAGYKPPASVFNWFWYNASHCIQELQQKFDNYGAASTVYVDIKSEATTEDGSIFAPFKSIQAALDSITDDAVINISPDVYAEDVTCSSNNHIMLQGSGAIGQRMTSVTGSMTVDEASEGVGMSGINFSDGLYMNSTDGGLYFDNCHFSTFVCGQTSSGTIVMDFCEFEADMQAYGTANMLFRNTDFGTGNGVLFARGNGLTATGPTIQLDSCLNVALNHILGAIIVSGNTRFKKYAANYCINSTAEGIANPLLLWSGTTAQEDGTFGVINQGLQGGYYAIGNFIHALSGDTFNGTRLNVGMQANDIYDTNDYSGTELTPDGNFVSDTLQALANLANEGADLETLDPVSIGNSVGSLNGKRIAIGPNTGYYQGGSPIVNSAGSTVLIGADLSANTSPGSVVIGRNSHVGWPDAVTNPNQALGYSVSIGSCVVVRTGSSIGLGERVTVGNYAGTAPGKSIGIGTNVVSNEGNSISIGFSSSSSANSSISIGTTANASGANGIAIGDSTVSAANCISIGRQCRGESGSSVSIGNFARSATGSISIGSNIYANGVNAISIGSGSNAGGSNSISIGTGSRAPGDGSIGIGLNVNIVGAGGIGYGRNIVASTNSICIGSQIPQGADNSITIGHSSSSLGRAIAIGPNTNASTNGISIGSNSVSETRSISIGTSAFAVASNSISIGLNSSAQNVDGISIGNASTVLFSNGGISIGAGSATRGGDDGIAIGRGTLSNTYGGVSIGSGSLVELQAIAGISIGYGALVNQGAANSISIGFAANTSGTNSVSFGPRAATTTSGMFYIGPDYTALSCPVQWTPRSDGRDKTDIENASKSTDLVRSLRPVVYKDNKREYYIFTDEEIAEREIDIETWKYKIDGKPYDYEAYQEATKKRSRTYVGFIAQEIQDAIIETYGDDDSAGNIVYDDHYEREVEDGHESKLSVAYSSLIPHLVGTIQELYTKVEDLEKELKHLKK